MNSVVVLLLLAFAAGASACPPCKTMKSAICDGDPCTCTLQVGKDEKQTLDCEKLVPKCFLMMAEMQQNRAKAGRFLGKPTEDAIVDNDGIYDPECESTGTFKALQCNNTEECWCVNSAGVRRTDKSDKSLKCDKLVETYWVRLQLKHKEIPNYEMNEEELKTALQTAIKDRYRMPQDIVDSMEMQYDKDARLIVLDLKKEKDDKEKDLSGIAYYMEKDVKQKSLFHGDSKFEPEVGGNKVEMEDILVHYVDAEPPTFTMRRLTGGVIAVIVVVVLAVIAGLLVVYFANKRDKARYQKTHVRELDEMPK
ncbi:epithelial cell adhesion molecule [Conger conger]|uniref:epithelial cell adhesion molecule n=1 Tax=Conger conger TaxID=82655 RepID=UPI002A5A2ED7|nr:epithelial cell adhesion molecule [Conger conger]